jgi:hypothetical protein
VLVGDWPINTAPLALLVSEAVHERQGNHLSAASQEDEGPASRFECETASASANGLSRLFSLPVFRSNTRISIPPYIRRASK